MFQKIILASILALASVAAQAQGVRGSWATAYVDPDGSGPQRLTFASDVSPAGFATSADVGKLYGQRVSSGAASSAWINRIGVNGSAFGSSAVRGAAGSFYAINQMATGGFPTAAVSYSVHVSGSYTPGSEENLHSRPGPQGLNFFLLAYYGEAIASYGIVYADGTPDLIFVSDAGEASLLLPSTNPHYKSPPGLRPFAASTLCFNNPKCISGGLFSDTVSLNVTVPVGKPFYMVGYLVGATDGLLDFMHTVELESITVEPGRALISDDGGALVSDGNGNYRLAAVPEPATWGMMIAGFGLVGVAARRRRRLQAW